MTASSTTQDIRKRDSWLRRLVSRREVITFGLLVVAFFISSRLSPYFLDVHYIFDATSLYAEIGVMALAMTFVIISGNIDLSAASMLAVVAVSFGLVYTRLGLPLPVAIALALLQGSILGMINGLIVTRFKLPSMT